MTAQRSAVSPRHNGPVLADIVIYDGVDELDAVGPYEVFGAARRAGADITPRLVTRQRQLEVVGAHGLRLRPDAAYEPGTAILIVTGGSWLDRGEAGTWGEVQRGDWLPLLRAAADDPCVTIASVCTGGMLLAHAGVIGSRPAVTHHTAWADLRATGATLVRDRVVDDGDLVTSAGVTSGIDLALWLVEREFSRAIADAVADRMEYPRFRPARAPA